MNTFLGAAAELGPDDVDADLVARRAGHVPRGLPLGPARGQGGVPPRGARSRTTPGDGSRSRCPTPFCVDRHRDEFLEPRRARRRHPVRQRGRDHARSTRSTTSTTRCSASHDHCEIAALTRSAKGSVVVTRRRGARRSTPHPVPASVVDTTGAGDLYAAGFLYGLTHGYDLGTLRTARRARGGRGDLAPRRRGPRRSLAELAAPAARRLRPLVGEAPPLPHRRRRARRTRSPSSSSASADADERRPGLRARSRRRCASPATGADRGDLKIANAALKEMRYAFHVFAPYRAGAQGRDLRLGPHAARRPALRADPRGSRPRWPSATGWSSPAPAPGSWRPASRAPAPDNAFGVSIRLPFEAATSAVPRRRPEARELPLLLHPQARRS